MTALVTLVVGFALGVVFQAVMLTWKMENHSKLEMVFRRVGELLERYKLKSFYRKFCRGLGGDLFRVARVVMALMLVGFIWGLMSRMSQPAQTCAPQQDQADTSQYSPFGKRWSPNDPQSQEATRKVNAWTAAKKQVWGPGDIDRSFEGVQKREQQKQYDDSMNDHGTIPQPKW